MVLGDKSIKEELQSGEIVISDYDSKRQNPASYDVLLGKQIAMYLPKRDKTYFIKPYDLFFKFIHKKKIAISTLYPELAAFDSDTIYDELEKRYQSDTMFQLVEKIYNSQPFDIFYKFIHYIQRFIVIDPKDSTTYESFIFDIPEEGFIIKKNHFYLYSIEEWIELGNISAEIKNKSSIARLGVLIHLVASWIDPGFPGNITLEVVSWFDTILRPGMKIGQIIFHETTEVKELYKNKIGSKYSNQTGVQPSKYSENYV